ncbi:unnamed protein product [Paramecium pentaurelia]|uniref:Cyclic nucleotide-binding domain-containing protein n=1 Tax=Paramecium pentaurelia TaxID=43138 RepID=A0A8S1VEU8_9CILI|nr:unnamed protein product [Paramecium pentaurelia]
MKSSILPESIHKQYFANHINSLKSIKARKNKVEEESLGVIRQISMIKKIKNQVQTFESLEENKSIAYSNQKIRQAIMKITNQKYTFPKLPHIRKEKTEVSDEIERENKRLKKSIANLQNSLTFRTNHQTIKKSYQQILNYNKMNNYNNDSEIVNSSIGPLAVRRSTLNFTFTREYDLPSDSFDKAIEILQKNLQFNEQAARIYMQDILREFSYFKALESQEEYFDYIEQTISSMEYKQVKRGNIVFHCGERGDYFYLILRGTGIVYVPKKEGELTQQKAILMKIHQCKEDLANTKKKDEIKQLQKQLQELQTQLQEYQNPEDILLFPFKSRYYQKLQNGQMICLYKKVNVMKEGECFGEVSLFRNEPRAATLIASETLHLGALNKSNYLRIFEVKLEKLNFTLGMLSKLFPQSSKENVIQLSFDFQKKIYSINQIIFKQGDIVDGLYLIFSGIVEIISDNVRVNQFCEGQFVGLFDLKNPDLRTYTAISGSYETIIYFLPKKNCNGLDKFMRERMNDLRISSETYRQEWIKKCHNMIALQKKESNKAVLKGVNTKDILQQCILLNRTKTNSNTISKDRINEIVEYNNVQSSLKEKLHNVKLCLQMRDFDKEKELVEKMMKQQHTLLPRLRERPRNLVETYTVLMSKVSRASPQAMFESQNYSEHLTRNIHVDRMKYQMQKKKSEQIVNQIIGI